MCSWHQKPALTTSNNSSKPSARLDAPFDKPTPSPSPSKLQGPERRIDRCTHAPLVSTVVLNMWSTSRLCSLFARRGKLREEGNREGIIPLRSEKKKRKIQRRSYRSIYVETLLVRTRRYSSDASDAYLGIVSRLISFLESKSLEEN